MVDVKVYEPCPHCDGQGWHAQPPLLGQWTQPNLPGTRMICNACGGTGKGKVKEIRDEAAR